ncbi:hypothetical protein SASPL_123744 [Salvia splendens]|uniref:DUF4005 domain-containing protein n=1 Tax=Salvia splendens TaxID=180675 RepID=A0A8X8XLL8_SALSN|nr:hypothetical protein SASPL_123744 [Salvia splendens]
MEIAECNMHEREVDVHRCEVDVGKYLNPVGGPATPEKFEYATRSRSMKHEQTMILKRNGSRSGGTHHHHDPEKSHASRVLLMDSRRLWEQGDDRSDKILEVDTGNIHHVTSKRRTLFYSSHLSLGSDQNCPSYTTSKDSTARQSVRSMASGEVQSLSPFKFAEEDPDESAFCTSDNSPAFYSASSRSKRGGPFTLPRVMRPNYERSSSTKRYSVQGYGNSRPAQRVSTLHANFTSKAYPGSGRLDRSGMPVRGDFDGFSGGGGNCQRF